MHISFSYAKILGETNFQPVEIPRSGSKAKDGEKRERRERLNDGNNNGQTTHGAHKRTGVKLVFRICDIFFPTLPEVWQ